MSSSRCRRTRRRRRRWRRLRLLDRCGPGSRTAPLAPSTTLRVVPPPPEGLPDSHISPGRGPERRSAVMANPLVQRNAVRTRPQGRPFGPPLRGDPEEGSSLTPRPDGVPYPARVCRKASPPKETRGRPAKPMESPLRRGGPGSRTAPLRGCRGAARSVPSTPPAASLRTGLEAGPGRRETPNLGLIVFKSNASASRLMSRCEMCECCSPHRGRN